MFAQVPISTAAHDLIIGLLEHDRLETADAMCCPDAREYRATLEQRLDAVGDILLSSVRPLVEYAANNRHACSEPFERSKPCLPKSHLLTGSES